MASFAEILAKRPKVQTRQALMVIGLQNDFVNPTGHLPVDTTSGFIDHIQSLITKFRDLNGNIIWVQTLYEADRLANTPSTGEGDAMVIAGLVDGEENGSQAGDDESIKDLPVPAPQAQSRSAKHKQRALDLFKRVSSRRKALPVEEAKVIVEEDEELFLLKRMKKGAACMPDTEGAQFTKEIRDQVQTPRDALIKTSNYSAFSGTNLLLTLRARLVTEIYICGCLSNVSVLATVIDGARHGIKINVVQDALGFRKQARHDLAIKRMDEFFDAWMVTSAEVLAKEHFEVIVPVQKETKPDTKDAQTSKDELEALVGNLTIDEKPKAIPAATNGTSARTAADSRNSPITTSKRIGDNATTEHVDSDEEFAAAAARFRKAKLSGPAPTDSSEPKLVQSKTRMRKKKKKKPTEGATVDSGAPNDDLKAANEQTQPPTAAKEAKHSPKDGHKTRDQSPQNEDLQQPLTSAIVIGEMDSSKDSTTVRAAPASSEVLPKESATNPAMKESGALSNTPASLHLDATPMPNVVPTKLDSSPSTRSQTTTTSKTSKPKSLATLPMLSPDDCIAEGDSRIVHNLIPPDYFHPSDSARPLADTIFQQLYSEVRWQKMLHQQGEVPRLVCCQGDFGDDGSKPIYRHPSDQSLPLLHFSPKVQWIRKAAEKLVGHPLNHVLIQLYRGGNDYISEHSDKTLDIAKGSSIVNISFGAQRTMRLRTKKDSKAQASGEVNTQRETQRVAMPHNSMFVLGLKSNERWLHGIMADKRLDAERSEMEKAYSGARISLTFRNIATFLDAKETNIWGQGATSKNQRGAADVVNNDEAEGERMVRAFSRENHSNEFDWEEWYGDGFDVLHLHEPPEQLPILFASDNAVATSQVQLALWESKIKYTTLGAPGLDKAFAVDQKVVFRDDDTHCTEVEGVASILHYLDRYHTFCADRSVTAAAYTMLPILTDLSNSSLVCAAESVSTKSTDKGQGLSALLHVLSEQLANHGGPFIAGKRFSIADCLIWPILDVLVDSRADWDETKWPELSEYYRLAWKKKACLKKLRVDLSVAKEKV